MTFKYNVGLQNVGSYQVSGRPWCKHFATTAGSVEYVSFPNVTESLWAHFEENSNGHEIQLCFAEPKTGMDMPNDQEYFETTNLTSKNLTEWTVGFWVKNPTVGTRVIEFKDKTAIIVASSTSLRVAIENNVLGTGVVSNISEWNFIALSVTTGATAVHNLYWNGINILSDAEAKSAISGDLFIGTNRSTINSNGMYDDMSLFAVALNDDEVYEMYQKSNRLSSLQTHSRADDLVSFWDFESNLYKNYVSNPDDGLNVYDRISDHDLSWNAGGSALPAAATYALGSVSGRALRNHSISLTGHTEIHLPFKTTGIIYSSSNNDDFSLFASLTSIPASRMHELTGPGIDE